MNRYQRILIAIAACNALLMLLLPPFTSLPMARGVPSAFEGFLPVFLNLGVKPVHQELLFLEIVFLACNTLAAWIALQHRGDEALPSFKYSRGIALFALADLALILLFPPFEPYSGISRALGSSFDSFYFILGDRSHRALYLPLLEIEIMLIAINSLALWLLFQAVERSDEMARRKILHLAEELPDAAVMELAHQLEDRVAHHHAPTGQRHK